MEEEWKILCCKGQDRNKGSHRRCLQPTLADLYSLMNERGHEKGEGGEPVATEVIRFSRRGMMKECNSERAS